MRMLRYLKAAFLAAPRLPVVGRFPVILAATLVSAVLLEVRPIFGIFGFVSIFAFCFALASTQRFRDIVDAQRLADKFGVDGPQQMQMQRGRLVSQLRTEARTRLAALENKCRRILETYRNNSDDPLLLQNNRDALDKLQWVYLRLLLGAQVLTEQSAETTQAALNEQIKALENEIRNATRDGSATSSSIQESRQATLELLQKRLEHHEHRKQKLEEIRTDLKRVETQIDLALDDAAVSKGSAATSIPDAISIDLARRLLDPVDFGASSKAISDLDRTFGTADPLKQTE